MVNEVLDKRKILVAVIDSGIDTNIAGLKSYVKFQTGYLMNSQGEIIEDKDMKARHEHGTAIGLVIRSLCREVEFISINILDENLLSDGRLLIHALKIAIDLKPDIIHLSLGTTRLRYWYALRKLVKLAEKNNITIVSALNNSGARSYPACIKGVIKAAGANLKKKDEFYIRNEVYYAPFNLIDIEGMDELSIKKVCGNSMAAAYITGHICNHTYFNSNVELYDMRKHKI